MARIERRAVAVWRGSSAKGSGDLSAATGAFSGLPYSEPTRLGDPHGQTSPEELLAAAHAGCFAMSLAAELTRIRRPPRRLEVTATAVMDEREGRHDVVASELEVLAAAEGLGADELRVAVEAADAGCPFSRLVKASGDVRVSARLA